MGKGTFLGLPTSDGCTYSAGTWQATLPLANLKTQQPSEVARTTGVTTAITRFELDAGVARNWQAFALINHNISSAGTITLTISNSSTFASGNTVIGPLTARQAAAANLDAPWEGYEATATPGGTSFFYQHASSVSGRYMRIQITDTANAAGYIQLGRFMAGVPLVPSFNFTFGAGVQILDPSTAEESVGGQMWWDVRPKKRRITLSYDAVSRDVALGALYDLQTKLGLTGNLFFVYDPDEAENWKARRMMYCGFESFEPLIEANPSITAPYTASIPQLEIL